MWSFGLYPDRLPLSMGFSRQEYWSGLPFPSPGDLPNPGTECMSPVFPALQADSLPTERVGKTQWLFWVHQNGPAVLVLEDLLGFNAPWVWNTDGLLLSWYSRDKDHLFYHENSASLHTSIRKLIILYCNSFKLRKNLEYTESYSELT